MNNKIKKRESHHIKIPVLATILVCLVCLLTSTQSQASAVVGFDAGNIIDDAVFTNKNTMNVSQIQSFLNSKVTACDTYGVQTSEFGGGTRAQWAASKGYSTPFTCLKDYTEGGVSSAQIIYNISQQYKINPQVLIVLLQKEQGLITDTWPLTTQYKTATGYGCPDTAACDTQYYGFTNQLSWAAKMFRSIIDNNPNWYTPYILGNNYIQWNPNSSCGGSIVNIQNRSTQALYNYTPYQPNQAALSAGYGIGDSCGAYGNRNFYLYFTDWFGSTKIYDPYGWDVVKTADNAATYLVVGNTKRWIPSAEIFNDWNLSLKPINTVSQNYLDSIPTIPPLGRLGYYDNKYYYVDGGKKYWLSDSALIKAWGQADNLNIASPAYIALSTIPDSGEATFYISLPANNQIARLIDGKRYLINASDADRWQANPITLSSDAFNSTAIAATLDYHVSVNGIKYIVDNGRMLNVNSSDLLRDYSQTNSTFVEMPSLILNYLPATNAGPVVTVDGVNCWYLLREGVRYYIPSVDHLNSWGVYNNPINISSHLAMGFPQNAQPLPVVVKNSSNNKYYLLDGEKHELTGVAKDAFLPSDGSVMEFSQAALSNTTDGSNIDSPIIMSPQKNIFTIDSGVVYYIQNQAILNGLGYPRKYSIGNVSQKFINITSNNMKTANMFVKINSTNYFLQDGNAFPIETTSLGDWVNGQNVPLFQSANLLTRFDIQDSIQLGNYINEGGKKYIISNGIAYNVNGMDLTFSPSNQQWTPLSIFGLPRSNITSNTIISSDANDSRVFLLSQGLKQHILSGDILSAYKKISELKTVSLSPHVLSLYNQVVAGSDVSPAIYASNQGIKILDPSGGFYGFPNADTANNFMNNNTINKLDFINYNQFNRFVGNLTKLIRDPSGKVYWVESGKKRWITNSTAFKIYESTPITNIPWNIINWLPTGTPID